MKDWQLRTWPSGQVECSSKKHGEVLHIYERLHKQSALFLHELGNSSASQGRAGCILTLTTCTMKSFDRGSITATMEAQVHCLEMS